MADKPKKTSPLLERTGSLTGDRSLSDLVKEYNLDKYAAPAAAALVGVPVVGKFAKPVAKAVGREAARRADKYMGDVGLRLNVVKPEGGQFISSPSSAFTDRHGNDAVSNWLQTAGRKYVVNRMGTPADEIRLLADRGITHMDPEDMALRNFSSGAVNKRAAIEAEREAMGFPATGMASTGEGRSWESLSDAAIRRELAGRYQEVAPEDHWMHKLDPNENVFNLELDPNVNLGFDKLADAVRRGLDTGALKENKLNMLSVGDAVKLAQKHRIEDLARVHTDLPVVRDYGDKGFSWRKLYHEDPAVLDEILAREGDIMQNCIHGYCSDVLDDGTELYTLRDAYGNPHVDIEVSPGQRAATQDFLKNVLPAEEIAAMSDAELINAFKENFPALGERLTPDSFNPTIKQIKGKQNEAPIEDYLPYVQDFVMNPIHDKPFRSVGDLENTGLIDLARLREHGLFDLSSSGARGRDINAELNRIYPAQRDQFGAVLSGEHGVRIPSYDMMRGVVQEMPGNYASPSSLIDYLKTIEPRPVEHGYSKYWENVEKPEGFAKGGLFEGDEDWDSNWQFKDLEPIRVTPTAFAGTFQDKNAKGSYYDVGADISLADKIGFGASGRGTKVKFDGGEFNQNVLSQLRGRYLTDDGIEYSGAYTPSKDSKLRAYRLSRRNPEAQSELSLSYEPARRAVDIPGEEYQPGTSDTTWLRYSKEFAEGGEVDYDEMYEFK